MKEKVMQEKHTMFVVTPGASPGRLLSYSDLNQSMNKQIESEAKKEELRLTALFSNTLVKK